VRASGPRGTGTGEDTAVAPVATERRSVADTGPDSKPVALVSASPRPTRTRSRCARPRPGGSRLPGRTMRDCGPRRASVSFETMCARQPLQAGEPP
jgi:hypothetical protein